MVHTHLLLQRGVTALHVACKGGSDELAELLLDHGGVSSADSVSVFCTGLHLNSRIVKFFIFQGLLDTLPPTHIYRLHYCM
jgi:hypothetical protein